MVSDEANEKFSKIELKALRESFIAVNRMNLGPEKRGNLNFNKIKNSFNQEIIAYIKDFSGKSHYLIISAKDNSINAFVSFYGEYPATVQLTDEYAGEAFLDGLICDWKNRNEFRLEIE